MTYREHRAHSDRAYLAALFARHITPSRVAEAAGLHRSHLYRVAARCGFHMPQFVRAGNEQWKALEMGANP